MKNAIIIYPSSIIDIRLYKFIKSLSKKYKVTVLSDKFLQKSKIFKDLNENDYQNIEVGNRLPTNFPYNFNRNNNIRNLIKDIDPEIVISRDIFMSLFKKDKTKNDRTTYYLDFCDHFPEVMEVLFGIKGKFLKIIANKVEKKALKTYDEIIFVSNEAQQFVKKKYGLDFKSSILENVPIKSNYTFLNKNHQFDLVYLGTINQKIRNLEVLFDAIKILKNEKFKVSMNIYYFNHQSKIKDFYVKMIKEKELEEQVYFKEAVSKDKLLEVLSIHKIGIVPHCRNEATDYTIPNKIYDYMEVGLPILASDNPSLKSLINKYEVGETYEGNAVESCAEKIKKMLQGNLENYSLNGKKAINNELNWDIQIKTLDF